MLRRILLLTALLLLPAAPLCRNTLANTPTVNPEPEPPPSQWPAHPRLIATRADWEAIPARRRANPELDAFVGQLVSEADVLCRKPVLTRVMTGRRLLGVSREYLRRTLLFSLAWKTTGRHRYLERAKAELLAVAAFNDWNPSHFLDVAEICAGTAFGYDWLYENLSPAERATIRRALIDKGLSHQAEIRRTFHMGNNWAQVCAGGLSLAALAIGDEEPELARSILAQAHEAVPAGMQAYAPDGVYPEGPSYWSYGSTYEVLLLASLRSALRQDWDIPAQPGFAQTARFFAHAVSPLGYNFNYADGGERAEFSPALLYLAREAGEPALCSTQNRFLHTADHRVHDDRFSVLACFWWPDRTMTETHPTPTHFHGQGSNPVAMWRSSWTDPLASYFAIKAGGAGVSHGHMDGGSFVFEAKGVRWALDLGMQNYESLESKHVNLWDRRQDSDRWRVFRLGSQAHNTLTLADGPHRADGLARLVNADEQGALIDLKPLFLDGQVTRAERRALIGPTGVELQDLLEGLKPGTHVRWAMNTRADIRIKGNEATLYQAGESLRISFSGRQVSIRVLDISKGPAPYDAPNPGVRQLIVEGAAGEDGSWLLHSTLDSR